MRKIVFLCLVLFNSAFSIAQEIQSITGTIRSNKGVAIGKATVHLVNTSYIVATNDSGKFEINNIPAGKYKIQVTAIGYAAVTENLQVKDGNADVAVRLTEDFAKLDQVIVTAQKREEDIYQLPLSISVINSRAVHQFRLWNTKEISGVVPNLYSANPGDERNVTSIRGITTTSYDPAVATYIDGVNQFNLDTYIPQLLDIDRIEVLRGPQGTLYGRNAMGGVINIITKQPGNTTSGFAEVNLGNYAQKRFSAGIRTPVIRNKLFIGIAAMYNSRDGFYTNAVTGNSFDNQKSITQNGYLKWQVNTKWTATLKVKGHHYTNEGAFPLQVPFGGSAVTYTLAQDAVTKMKDDIFNSSLSIFYSGRSFLFSSQTAYQRNYRIYQNPIDADFSPLDAITIINNYGKKFNNTKVYTQEFKFSSPAVNSSRLTWTAGTYLFSQKVPNKQATRFGKDAPMIGVPDSLFSIIGTTRSSSRGMAFFGQISYDLLPMLQFIAGIRYDYEKKDQSVLGEYQKDPDPQPQFETRPDTSASTSYHSVIPKVGISYNRDNGHFYAIYSRGFRAGGFTGFSSDPSQPPLFAFKPEFSNNFELGFKTNVLNETLRFHAAAFYINVTDIQVPTLVLPDATTITRNAGKLTSKGAEVEIDASLIKRIETGLHAGYTDATYKTLKIPGGSGEVDLSGKKQIFTPATTSLYYIQYTQPFGRKQRTSVIARGEWFHFGKQYFNLSNTIIQESYSLFNTRLGLAWDKFELMFWGRNLSDKEYIDYAYEFGAVHLANPKTLGGTLSIRL